MHRLEEMVRLHRLGTPCHQASRLLGMSPNTQRKYREALRAAGLLDGDPAQLPELAQLQSAVEKHIAFKPPPPQQASSLEPWRDRIEAMHKRDASPKAIYDALRHEEGFTASHSAVKRFCLRLRASQPVRPEDVAVPVETAPGQIAQVDFGYAGHLFDPVRGALRKAWFFVMTLAFSRHFFVRIVFSQDQRTWIDCHVRAFEFFGGVPHTIVPDNLKSAVINAAFNLGDQVGLNRSYRALAAHYGFKVDPTPARQPKKKGKVESNVKYIKRNFFRPRELREIDDAQQQLDQWNERTASVRKHGTTGLQPGVVFAELEQLALKPLPGRRYEPRIYQQVKVHNDFHVQFERRLYSVPFALCGQTLWLEATDSSVMLYGPDLRRVATHRRLGPTVRSTDPAHAPPGRAELAERDVRTWFGRADALDPQIGRYVRVVYDSDPVLSMLPVVQSMVLRLEQAGAERALQAVQRAERHGCYDARTLRRILDQGLEKSERAPVPRHGVLDRGQARFARSGDHFAQATRPLMTPVAS